MAALSAAWRLSHDEAVASVTVYQRGWRLGGKGASSRGANGRIEEHGLHVWLGYYDNAFRLMRECYAELDRPTSDPQCPIATWRDAFAPSDSVGLATRHSGHWEEWTALFSSNDEVPGEPEISSAVMSPQVFVTRSLTLVRDFVASLGDVDTGSGRIVLSSDPRPPATAGTGLVELAQRAVEAAAALALEATHLALGGVRDLSADLSADLGALGAAVGLLDALRARIRHQVVRRAGSRRMFELLDLITTSTRGILADGLLVDPRGFSAINGEEYRDWLRRHGAADETFDSPLVDGVYDLVFGYRDGDPALPRFAAGTGLFLSAKIFFDYKGSIFWKMQAGMGDVVFAPLYQALSARGVRFELFHDVRELALSADGTTIERVVLAQQAELAPGVDEYRPLQRYGGLPCFPAVPDMTQLAARIHDPRMLETLWHRERGTRTVELRHGVDFDAVVYALSIGMVPHTCGQILERDARWRHMVRRVGTVATQSVQLWLRGTDRELGWSHPGSTLTGFVKPFDTVASMSHLIATESWPTDATPGSIFYFCNTLPEGDPPGPDALDYVAGQQRRVREHAVRFLGSDAGRLLPGVSDATGFDWDQLVVGADAGADLTGPARLDTQFWTANVDPSDRYVQSLPGTDRFRLAPDDSGVRDLFLAGDWTDCGLNAGCIEAAVVSGLQAANAVTGQLRWHAISGGWTPLVGSR